MGLRGFQTRLGILLCLIREPLKKLLNIFYITVFFFKFETRIYQPIKGIPMISDPTPFMASLSLYYYDNTWIRQTKMKDPVTNRKFGNVFRFIDDLTAINDGGNISSTT